MPTYPDSHKDLLDVPGFAAFTAVTPSGHMQSTLVWYLLDDDGKLKITSTGARKKVGNLRADPRVTLLIFDPTNMYRTLEIRGTASVELDDGLVLQKKVGVKYDSDVTSFDAPGTVRYVITVEPEKINTFG
jgi:PPOX class probable F420-dependent enzyme